ncbi:hypothetical protein KQI61_19310 [Anaerocolumna aminovalerica]|uniref:hypothetical protein n=1 Tax=Anaerocolumna aminovalerica TaxID=1527 RepID=UPI001C0F1443|nr:hypothetical protein [Anaerocolumna aminovalerica]MBU5334331.1 hypothetical protein [Anaerocolumna aminovalerica]
MNQSYYWEKFEETGSILDYLNYTACTMEDAAGYRRKDIKEGGCNDDGNTYDRDGFISHANWRL